MVSLWIWGPVHPPLYSQIQVEWIDLNGLLRVNHVNLLLISLGSIFTRPTVIQQYLIHFVGLESSIDSLEAYNLQVGVTTTLIKVLGNPEVTGDDAFSKSWSLV